MTGSNQLQTELVYQISRVGLQLERPADLVSSVQNALADIQQKKEAFYRDFEEAEAQCLSTRTHLGGHADMHSLRAARTAKNSVQKSDSDPQRIPRKSTQYLKTGDPLHMQKSASNWPAADAKRTYRSTDIMNLSFG